MRGQSPVPSGLGPGKTGGLVSTTALRSIPNFSRNQPSTPWRAVNPFTVADTFRYYILDRNIVGSVRKSSEHKEYIHKYKSYYVHAMRDPIKAAAGRFDLPAILVAGTVYNEVGGADMIKPYVHIVPRPVLGLGSRRPHLAGIDLAPAATGPAALWATIQPRSTFLKKEVITIADPRSRLRDLRLRQATERSPRPVLHPPRAPMTSSDDDLRDAGLHDTTTVPTSPMKWCGRT